MYQLNFSNKVVEKTYAFIFIMQRQVKNASPPLVKHSGA